MNKINNDLREILIVLTGVDINKLASEPVNIYPLKYIWKRDNMRCIICNRTWDDKIKLERHHFIPVKLGKYFGLTKEQMNNELNLGVMCQEHHCEKDLEIRRILHELFFNIWKEVYVTW